MRMELLQIIRIALQSLKNNRVRSALTMLGVIIGVASVILLVALGSGLQKYITDQMKSVGSNLIIVMPGRMDLNKLGQGGGAMASFMSPKFEMRDVTALETNSDYIKAAIPFVVGQEAIKYTDQKVYTEILGTTANFSSVINAPLTSGDYFTEADDHSGRKVIILGSDIAKTLFNGDDPIGQRVALGNDRFEVIGVLKNRGIGSNTQDATVIPLTTAQRIFNQDKIEEIYLQAAGADKVDLAIDDAKSILLQRLTTDDFTLLTQKDILGAVDSILGVLTSALAGIAAISLLVGGIGIMNIMLVSVTERTREIGLRKALGATPNLIMVQFLIESVIISVGGGIIGILLGGGGALALGRVMPVQVTPGAVFLAFSVSAIIGIIFGVMPARRAAKLNPIEALRYE